MQRLFRYFFRSPLTVPPLGATLRLLCALAVWSERQVPGRPLIGNWYAPGLGLPPTAALLCLAAVKRIWSCLTGYVDDVTAHRREDSGRQVVALRAPGAQWGMVGLGTRDRMQGLPGGFLPGTAPPESTPLATQAEAP